MESTSRNGRILVVKLSSLGDHFHALPAVHNLKAALDVEVDWVTQPEYKDLVQRFTDLDRVFSFPRQQFLQHASAFLKDLRGETYDYIIDLQGLLKSALVARCACGDRRIGPSYSREGARWFYSDIAGRRDKNRHAVEEALDVVKYLKLNELDPVFPVTFPPAKRKEPEPRVGLIPMSRWPSKNWPIDRFIQAGRALREKSGAHLFIVGSPEDQTACHRLAEGIGEGAVSYAGHTNLIQLGSLLNEMNLCITIDSGPMHMAAALGVPVLALFGPTDPVKTGPYGDHHRVIAAERTPCWPCRKRVCPACQEAMKNITPEVVIEMAVEMLG